MKQKIKKVMQINNSITTFSDVFLGGAVMILCGALGLAFYATLQKVFKMLGRIYVGYIQKKYACKDLQWIARVSVRCEALNGVVRALGMLIIPFHSPLGIMIVGVGNILYGLDVAFSKVYNEQVVDLITENVSERLAFKGELSYCISVWDAIGMSVNFVIFGVGYVLNIDEISLLNFVCFAYGILKIIDIATSFVERKIVMNIINGL